MLFVTELARSYGKLLIVAVCYNSDQLILQTKKV